MGEYKGRTVKMPSEKCTCINSKTATALFPNRAPHWGETVQNGIESEQDRDNRGEGGRRTYILGEEGQT